MNLNYDVASSNGTVQDATEDDTLPMEVEDFAKPSAGSLEEVAGSEGHRNGAEGGEEERPRASDEEVDPVLDHEQSAEEPPRLDKAEGAEDANLHSEDDGSGKRSAFKVWLQHIAIRCMCLSKTLSPNVHSFHCNCPDKCKQGAR